MSRTPADIEPRMLSRESAAAYCGMGTTLFDELVKDGTLPKPAKFKSRVLWDRRRLDRALDKYDDERNANPWDAVA